MGKFSLDGQGISGQFSLGRFARLAARNHGHVEIRIPEYVACQKSFREEIQ
jgi:hypothetical protein